MVMRPSGASCSRRNSAKPSLATILNPSAGLPRKSVGLPGKARRMADFRPTRSLRQDVFSVFHRQQNARAVVEPVAIFFREVIDALAGGDFAFGHQGLANGLAEFRR